MSTLTTILMLFIWWLLPMEASTSYEELVSSYEAYEARHSPERIEINGRSYVTGWPDVRPEAISAKVTEARALRFALRTIDQDQLSEDEQISLSVMETLLSNTIARGAFDEERLPFTGDSGFHSSVTFGISAVRLINAESADMLITRIEAIPAHFGVHMDNMRRGIETDFVSYKDPLETLIVQISDLSDDDIEKSPLYRPFITLPDTLSDAEQADIKRRAKRAVQSALNGFGTVLTFLETEYAPHTREKAGIVDLPEAKRLYQTLIAFHTTLPDLTPEEIHETGLKEVERIRAEMNEIIDEVQFEGSFSDFLDFLRTDPQFYAQSPSELMAEAARLSKDLDYAMPRFFQTLPRLPYGVEPVPDNIAPGYTTGRYIRGDLSTGRAGAYWVNTFALDQRPLYELPALTAHEAVPGHHHQIALAQELEDVPRFRQNYYATAFGEGWGLYAETLAGEMGLYKTPYQRFGKLSYEMWRACRLAADTGLHWYGWSREEAEACFTENSALAPLNIKTEVTRYIGWPGQALGYKVGEIKMLELREKAKAELGEDFDIREFHDVLLEKGSVPLSILEMRILNWIDEKKAS